MAFSIASKAISRGRCVKRQRNSDILPVNVKTEQRCVDVETRNSRQNNFNCSTLLNWPLRRWFRAAPALKQFGRLVSDSCDRRSVVSSNLFCLSRGTTQFDPNPNPIDLDWLQFCSGHHGIDLGVARWGRWCISNPSELTPNDCALDLLLFFDWTFFLSRSVQAFVAYQRLSSFHKTLS